MQWNAAVAVAAALFVGAVWHAGSFLEGATSPRARRQRSQPHAAPVVGMEQGVRWQRAGILVGRIFAGILEAGCVVAGREERTGRDQ